jgi:hypothetical protein
MKMTIHLHIVPRLIMSGSVLLLPQYFFMAWNLVKHRINFTLTPVSGHEAEHSLAYSVEVKNEWSNTSTPPLLLPGVVLV